ncbi:hypothetical protein MKW94_005291, partial [Papaver nudicaule]|nr:hypothetical protein [Papaver nudicaule]MCL7028553.1 hypothetical protein [Papaver nudicaule]
MDSFTSFFQGQQSSRKGWSYESLLNFRQISPVVQNHLKLVYLSLCCALISASVGAYLHILMNIGGLLTMFACLGSMLWLTLTPAHEEKKKASLLMASALFQGASIGPLIQVALDVDSSIIVSAFVGTGIAFACFSGAAMLAKRREYLYLGGFLSASVSLMFWLSFASSIFGGSAAVFKFELYFGLLVFMGYMVVDTQEIIEKAHMGDLDYINHSLTLFTDMVAVFVRVLIIM